MLPEIHPGEILKEEFMTPFGLSINALARELHVAPNRISQIVNGTRSINAETALRLACLCGTTAQFWTNLQSLYDLEIATKSQAPQIRREVRRLSARATPNLPLGPTRLRHTS